MERKPKFGAEAIFEISLAAAGLAIMAGALKLGFGNLKLPGSGFFPFFAGLILFAAQAAGIATRFARKQKPSTSPLAARDFGKLALLVAICAGWILAMPLLGYIAVTFIGVFALAKLFGLKGSFIPTLLAAGTSVAVYVLFAWLLYLDLPRGSLWPEAT